MREMGACASLVLVAAGAFLAFGASIQSSFIDINGLALLLFMAGLIGLGISLVLAEGWSWFGEQTYAASGADRVPAMAGQPNEYFGLRPADDYEAGDARHFERKRSVRRR